MARVRAYAPASVGNVGVGFDVLGVAMERVDGGALGDVVTAETAAESSFVVGGAYADAVPHGRDENLAGLAIDRFAALAQQHGHTASPVALQLDKQLPVGSGLGSSSCSAVAAVAAIAGVQPFELPESALLRLMAELEGVVSGSVHFDNVAPAYLGGMQLLVDLPDRVCVQVPTPDDWFWVLTHPGIRIATADAREVLPMNYDRSAVIAHGRYLGSFIHACHTGDAALAAQMLVDVVAEPWRRRLLPEFERVRRETRAMGALAVGISGSGPTIFSVAPERDIADKIAAHHARTWNLTGTGFQHVCRVSPTGVALTREDPA